MMAIAPACEVVGFTAALGGYSDRWVGGAPGLTPLAISPRQRLDDALKAVSGLPSRGRDCALPMVWVSEQRREFDAFVVLTDNRTRAGKVHPSQALRAYRERLGIPAKLVVVAMTSLGFSIADPDDAGLLDVVGLDTATPRLIADFAS